MSRRLNVKLPKRKTVTGDGPPSQPTALPCTSHAADRGCPLDGERAIVYGNIETLQTIITEIEATLNDRPITYV